MVILQIMYSQDMQEQLYYFGNKAIIQNDKGEVLALKVTTPEHEYWDFPGGRINQGEDAETALRREVTEETGLTGLVIHKQLTIELTPIQIPVGDEIRGLVLATYHCSVSHADNIVLEPGVEMFWLPLSELLPKLTKYSDAAKRHIIKELEG